MVKAEWGSLDVIRIDSAELPEAVMVSDVCMCADHPLGSQVRVLGLLPGSVGCQVGCFKRIAQKLGQGHIVCLARRLLLMNGLVSIPGLVAYVVWWE